MSAEWVRAGSRDTVGRRALPGGRRFQSLSGLTGAGPSSVSAAPEPAFTRVFVLVTGGERRAGNKGGQGSTARQLPYPRGARPTDFCFRRIRLNSASASSSENSIASAGGSSSCSHEASVPFILPQARAKETCGRAASVVWQRVAARGSRWHGRRAPCAWGHRWAHFSSSDVRTRTVISRLSVSAKQISSPTAICNRKKKNKPARHVR